MKSLTMLLALGLWVLAPATAGAQGRVIVAFKADSSVVGEALVAEPGRSEAAQARRMQRRADALASRAGRPLTSGKALGDLQQVLLAKGLDSTTLAAKLATHPEVAWAVPDQRRRALHVPNDPLFGQAVRSRGPDAGQWYLRAPDSSFASAINAQTAWDRVPVADRSAVVVAIIDTGVRPDHPDLAGRLLPGIDTIHDAAIANDGDGADTDAADPGDWVTAAEDSQTNGQFKGCGVSSSSWHGTMVATIAGASGDDGIGMAGTAYGVRILPVRVLGKCGGYDSDIIDGMLWAVGLKAVAGQTNPTPAKVLNLSLGGDYDPSKPEQCTAYTAAAERIRATGAVIVAAVGNTAGRAVGVPARCTGFLGVAGLRHAGSKVGFSDLGPEVAISAPGGNCVNVTNGSPCLYPILAGRNDGTRAPNAGGSIWTDSYLASYGTSFSAPLVSGTLALMAARRPQLTVPELTAALQASARAFPSTGADNGPGEPLPEQCRAPDNSDQYQCYCTTALCGAGMLDAHGAVLASEGNFARITLQTATPTAGSPVLLSAAGSLVALGRNLARYQWTLVDGGGVVAGFSGATDAASASLTASAAGTVRLALTLTDDAGASSRTETSFSVVAAPVVTPPPTPTPAGGGGGGLGLGAGLGLLAAVLALARRR